MRRLSVQVESSSSRMQTVGDAARRSSSCEFKFKNAGKGWRNGVALFSLTIEWSGILG